MAVDKVNYPFLTAFVKAIFAGWLITTMAWLILAAEGLGPRLLIIWIIGFLIVAGHFNHVVISAAEIFTAMGLGAPISIREWFLGNFVPALIGNLLEGRQPTCGAGIAGVDELGPSGASDGAGRATRRGAAPSAAPSTQPMSNSFADQACLLTNHLGPAYCHAWVGRRLFCGLAHPRLHIFHQGFLAGSGSR
jgi:Formate/nitrite transporter